MLTGTSGDISSAIIIRCDRVALWKAQDSTAYKLIKTKLYLIEDSQWWIDHQNAGVCSVANELAERSEGSELVC